MIAVVRRSLSIDRMIDARGSLRAIGLMRMLFGVIVIRHLLPDLRSDRTPVERFHVPWWDWLPVPSADTYRMLLWVGVVAGAAMIVGIASRWATVTAFLVVSYLLFVDMTGFAHNRGFLVWVLGGLAVLPTGRALSLDARIARRSEQGDLWPVFLLRIVLSSVYLVSGITKLVNPDWRNGLVLWDRVTRMEHLIPFQGWAYDVLVSRAFHRVLSPVALAVEVFIGLGLWSRRTRLAAIWVAIVFHGSIEFAASVQTFSYSAIAALLIWVTPSTRDRTLVGGSGHLRRAVRTLDWLGRFRVEDRPGEHLALRVVDRDGSVVTGRRATLLVTSRLPLLFPFVAPFLAVDAVLRRGNAVPAPGPGATT